MAVDSGNLVSIYAADTHILFRISVLTIRQPNLDV